MVEMPLIITRPDGVQWFSGAGALRAGRLWAKHDAELRGETERMGRELRDNLIGRTLWGVLELTTRNFLASGEAVFRARRDDPRFDFSACAIEYAKAVETELNALIFPLLRRESKNLSPAARVVYDDARRIDLGGLVPHQTLGVLKRLLESDDTVRKTVKRVLGPAEGGWLCDVLPREVAALAQVRDPGAHSAVLSRESVSATRGEVLGIGSEGLIVRLARVRLRAG